MIMAILIPVLRSTPCLTTTNYVIAVVTIAENEGSTTNYAYITGDVNSEAYANDEYTLDSARHCQRQEGGAD